MTRTRLDRADEALAALCEKAGWLRKLRSSTTPPAPVWWCEKSDALRDPFRNTDDALALARALGYDRVFIKMRYAGKIRVTLYKDAGGGASEMHNKAPAADTYAAAIVAALGSAGGV